MSEELWLAALVREWAVRVLPGDHGAADQAATLAVRAYAAGASFAEAHAQGQHYIACREQHPSQHLTRTRSAAKRGPLTPPLTLNRPRATDRAADRGR